MASPSKIGDASVSTSGNRRRLRWPWKRKKKKQQNAQDPSRLRNGTTATFDLSKAPNGQQPGVSYAAAVAAAYDHNKGSNGLDGSSEQPQREGSYSPPRPLLAQSSYGRSYPNVQHPPSLRKKSPMREKGDDSSSIPGTSWLCRTKTFQKVCDDAFKSIDTDGSGGVDEKELYSGLLLIHLKLGMYLGPAACKPLAREKCHTIFHKMDIDDSGYLDVDEFRHVMMVLFGNVFLRVIVQWACTITIVPLVAQKLTKWLLVLVNVVYQIIITLDERSFLANWIELAVEALWEMLVLRSLSPPAMLVLCELGDRIAEVPPAVWKALPVTFISIVLGIVVVPAIIFKIDDFFQWLVDGKGRKPVTVIQ